VILVDTSISVDHLHQADSALLDLFSAVSATDDEVLTFIEQSDLFGRGLNLVDVHLLAAVVLTPEALLWTRDKRLQAAATELSLSYL